MKKIIIYIHVYVAQSASFQQTKQESYLNFIPIFSNPFIPIIEMYSNYYDVNLKVKFAAK